MTVGELLDRMGSREIAEWMAYGLVEPFGQARGDMQAGIVAATVVNALRGKGARAVSPSEFVLEFGGGRQEEMSVEATVAAFGMIMGGV